MKTVELLLIALTLTAATGCAGPRPSILPPPPPSHPRGNRLADGPRSPGPHGPLSASDADGNGTVTRAEITAFMHAGPYRRIGLLAFFDQCDSDGDLRLSESEFAAISPPHAFDGTDRNADDVVTRSEVEDYVADKLYRRIGLEAFFDLLDTDQNDELSPDEIEAAHKAGQLPRD